MQFFDVSVREVDPGWEHAVLGLLGDLTLIRRFDPSAPVLRAVPEHDRPWLERRFAERRAALSFEPIGERRYRLAALAHREAQAADLPLRYVQWQRETLAESLDGARDEPREQTFGSAAEARAAFETRCAELVAAGEQLFDEPLALLRANSARDGALEQALARAAPGPARAAAAEVYADWLAQHGDPRGELALLWRAAERAGDGDERLSLRRRADAHARRFRARLYGPLHWEGLLERVSFGLRDGFIERAHLSAEIAPRALWRLCAVLFELPLACALRALSIEPGAQQKLVDALLELAVPPTLERLVLGRDEEAGAEAPASSYGMGNVERLEPLLARLPSLRSLQLRGETTDRVELELPELEQLRVDARYVGRFVDSLPQARCPRLRELDLRVRFFTKSAAARVLRLVEAPPPALDSLSLRGIEAVEPVVRALTASTLAARLRQLTLVSTQPAHEAMTHLGRHADALAALESLHIAPLDDEIRGALGPLAARLAEAPP